MIIDFACSALLTERDNAAFLVAAWTLTFEFWVCRQSLETQTLHALVGAPLRRVGP
jgi:hypothetical protein